MTYIQQNEYYRLKAQELSLVLKQVRVFIKKHNLSRGIIAEEVLRSFLSSILPSKVKVCQGFVEYNGALSRQCDIIIYDCHNYAPLYSFGNIEIIPGQAVYAVIEVKTRVDAKIFGDVLSMFEEIEKMRVANKYLFIYESCKVKTLKTYFYSPHTPSYDRKDNHLKYDHDNFVCLPQAIISLTPQYYLAQGHCQTDNHDMMGYMAFTTKDNTDQEVSCLQEFVLKLMEDINNNITHEIPSWLENMDKRFSREDEMKTYMVNDGFGLFEM